MSIDITPTTILGPSEGIGEHQAVNLTHNTKGSAWNRIGNNKLIDVDQFRHNYNPLTGIYEGRALMGQWTNEIKDPIDLSTTEWGEKDATVVDSGETGFEGKTLYKIQENSADNSHYVQSSSYSANAGDKIVIDAVIEANGRGWALLVPTETSNAAAWFDLNNGSVGTMQSGADEAVIKDQGNGRFRCILKYTSDGGSGRPRVQLSNADGVSSYQGNGSDGVNLYYFGLFKNRTSPPPTPVYGETAGQSYTQDPDIATVTDLDAIDFNPSEGTFVVEGIVPSSIGNRFVYSINDGTTDNRILLSILSDSPRAVIFINGTAVVDHTMSESVSVNNPFRIAVSYKEDDVAIALDGVVETASTSNQLPSGLNRLDIGKNLSESNFIEGFMNKLNNYPRRFSNEDLIQETTL